jgi:DNA invertase Pin-like site-specific DNA recombinase
MGRLTLNVLRSFAQFEREVTGERIRDKIGASKQTGMWMGGLVPLGYEVHERCLIMNESEAETVRGARNSGVCIPKLPKHYAERMAFWFCSFRRTRAGF